MSILDILIIRSGQKIETREKVKRSDIPREHFQGINENENGVTSKRTLILPYHSTLSDWFNLDPSIRNSESISSFKSKLLSFIRPVQSNIYNIFDPQGLKLLTRLRLGFSHLNEHRFRHNFQDCINPLCSCSLEIEDTSHYLLHCHNFSRYRIDLMNSVNSVRDHFESLSDSSKRDILLYGDSRLDTNKNKFILVATINYIKHSERFSGSLFE